MTQALHRYKVFETTDPDDAAERLVRLFGNQRTSINRSAGSSSSTSLSVASLGSSFLCHLRSSDEILFQREEARALIGVTFVLGGGMRVMFGDGRDFALGGSIGFVLPQDEGFKSILTGYDGLTFGVPRTTLDEHLESMTGSAPTIPIEFAPVIDGNAGAVVIHDSLTIAARQLAEPHSPLGHAAVAARMEEFIVNTLLHGLPHNYRDAIKGEHRPAAPKQVRRAEAFIREHAGEQIRLGQIAAAAGCSVRALQLAFKRFRDTTPMALLRRTRLELARSELMRSEPGTTTVTEVAAKLGFYNTGRFAQDYRKSFGQAPSDTLRFSANPLRHAG